jgi:hypothetical protein
MLLAQFGLIALLLAIIMLPRAIAIYYSTRSESKEETFEYDYR